ncbi:MAG: peptide-methionine (R)-S-oxide reductase MsrB [Flavobacteriaceae bacterium]|jgi:peptide-methionine (R)-S-oxide reductase
MKNLLLICLLVSLVSCQGNAQKAKETKTYAVQKSDAEWKAELPEMAYYVLRKAGTERAFSGPLNDNKKAGTYVCAGCQAPLYQSEYKYDSGSGWPSFDRGIDDNLEYDVDYKIGYPRTELKCNKCGGHLGHAFNDGPRETTGMRHCINSAALNFIPADETP